MALLVVASDKSYIRSKEVGGKNHRLKIHQFFGLQNARYPNLPVLINIKCNGRPENTNRTGKKTSGLHFPCQYIITIVKTTNSNETLNTIPQKHILFRSRF